MNKKWIFVLGVVACLMAGACSSKEKNMPTKAPEITDAAEELTKAPVITLIPGYVESEDELHCAVASDFVTEEEGDVTVFSSKLYYPMFYGKDSEALSKRMEALATEYKSQLEEQKEKAKQDYADCLANGENFEMREDELNISVSGLDETRVSLISSRFTNSGGPHYNYYQLGYVYKIKDAAPVSMDEFLKEYRVTAKEVSEYAAEQFLAQADGDIESFLITGTLSDAVLEFINQEHWYFTEDGIVIYMNPYEIAPYAYGSFECVISFEILKQGLKNQ